MLLAVFEPGKEMAIANFFLAIFCMFTVVLPLLLITRGDKTEANRDFLVATLNPWSQPIDNSKISPVVLSETILSIHPEPDLKSVSELNTTSILDSQEVISIEIKSSDESEESSTQLLQTDDELMAA